MSINSKHSVKCPKCGQLHEICVWNSITVSDSPDLKKDLLSGRINILRCDICGQTALLPDPLLYHDEEKKLLISFTPCTDDKIKERLFCDLKENSKKSGELENYDGYNLRFITDYNRLLETILIFDSGLHDKVTELIKLLILSQEQDKAEHRTAVFGKKENDELEFLIRDSSDGMCYTSRVPMSTYDTLYKELASSGIKYKSFNWEEIDSYYASKMLKGLNNDF
jgi:hypothetical protein